MKKKYILIKDLLPTIKYTTEWKLSLYLDTIDLLNEREDILCSIKYRLFGIGNKRLTNIEKEVERIENEYLLINGLQN